MSGRSLALVCTTLLLSTGCVTMGTFETAHTIGAGRTQWALEPSYWGASGSGGGEYLPSAAVAIRYGISDSAELGARLGFNGIDLLTKFQLMGGRDQFTLSLAPSVGGVFLTGTSSGGIGMVQVPLLIGIPLGSSELVLSPKVHDLFVFASDSGGSSVVQVLSVGAGVGLALRLGDSFQLLPEVTVLKPMTGAAASNGSSTEVSSLDNAGVLMQFGVGFLFGGR